MKPLRPLLAALFALAAGPLHGAAGAWHQDGPARVRLISEAAVASRDGELRLGLHFRLDPGWHVYWKNSGDAGYPPTVAFAPAPGLGAIDLLYPAPQRFELPGGLLAFGYEDEMVYPVRARLTGAPGERLRLAADLDYLVCEVDCIPYRSLLTLDLPLGDPRPDPETAPLIAEWWGRLPAPASAVAGVSASTSASLAAAPGAGAAGNPVLEVRIEGAEPTAGTDLFLEPHDIFEAGRPEMRRIPGGLAFRVPLSPKAAGGALPAAGTFAWTATGLARDGRPLAVEDRAEVPLTAAPASPPPGQTGGAPGNGLPGSLAGALLSALLAGLLASLTPGVLALLAGEGLSLRGVLDGRGPRPVSQCALAAVAGCLLAAWGLAAAAAARGTDGGILVWGAHLEIPGLATLLAVVATLLALNLWGFLEAPIAAAQRPSGDAAARPADALWRHALAGALAPLLALAWPVPLLAPPLGLAASRGPAALVAVATAAALGLALPLLAAAVAPRLLSWLPPAGPRSHALREGLGFAAGATTLWLLYRLARRLSPESLAAVELALLALALVAWLRRRASGKVRLSGALTLALAACALAAVWLADPSH
jgi:suppressor for copper-sensitivity B